MSKREKWLVGVSVVVFAAVIFLIIQGGSQFVLPKTQKEKVREQVDNMLLRDPESAIGAESRDYRRAGGYCGGYHLP